MPRGLGIKEMSAGGAAAPTNGFADPHLKPGADFNVIDLGGGNVVALCPACFAAAVGSVLAQVGSVLAAGGEGGATNGVNWNSVNWNSVNWNSVDWQNVNWNS